MTSREPTQSAGDHTVAIIGAVVVMIGLLVVLAIGLEETGSENTMPIMAMIGTGIVATMAASFVGLAKTNDTNKRTQAIQHSLNGGFDDRVTRIVTDVMDAKFREFDATLDVRMRLLVSEELDRRRVG